jgi:hypothetical protein
MKWIGRTAEEDKILAGPVIDDMTTLAVMRLDDRTRPAARNSRIPTLPLPMMLSGPNCGRLGVGRRSRSFWSADSTRRFLQAVAGVILHATMTDVPPIREMSVQKETRSVQSAGPNSGVDVASSTLPWIFAKFGLPPPVNRSCAPK